MPSELSRQTVLHDCALHLHVYQYINDLTISASVNEVTSRLTQHNHDSSNRCVPFKERTMALGLQWILVRVVGNQQLALMLM